MDHERNRDWNILYSPVQRWKISIELINLKIIKNSSGNESSKPVFGRVYVNFGNCKHQIISSWFSMRSADLLQLAACACRNRFRTFFKISNTQRNWNTRSLGRYQGKEITNVPLFWLPWPIIGWRNPFCLHGQGRQLKTLPVNMIRSWTTKQIMGIVNSYG